jgi:uncharacterized protein YuzE
MGKKLTFEYDKIGDILYIQSVEPYAEQESDELDDEIVARYNPVTGDLEGLEILWFTRRFEKCQTLELPVSFEARLAV